MKINLGYKVCFQFVHAFLFRFSFSFSFIVAIHVYNAELRKSQQRECVRNFSHRKKIKADTCRNVIHTSAKWVKVAISNYDCCLLDIQLSSSAWSIYSLIFNFIFPWNATLCAHKWDTVRVCMSVCADGNKIAYALKPNKLCATFIVVTCENVFIHTHTDGKYNGYFTQFANIKHFCFSYQNIALNYSWGIQVEDWLPWKKEKWANSHTRVTCKCCCLLI